MCVELYFEGCLIGHCSWLGSPFSLGRQILNLGSILCGRLPQILPVDKLVFTGRNKCEYLVFMVVYGSSLYVL